MILLAHRISDDFVYRKVKPCGFFHFFQNIFFGLRVNFSEVIDKTKWNFFFEWITSQNVCQYNS